MTLQSSGAISLNQIHIEASNTSVVSGSTVTINDTDVRALIGKSSGATSSFSEFYGAAYDAGGDQDGGCFFLQAMVALEDGSQAEIWRIEAGDRVRGSNGVINEVIENRYLFKSDTLYGWGGREPFVTGTHPFLTADGWKCFDLEQGVALHPELGLTQIAEGDRIVTWDGAAYDTEAVTGIVTKVDAVPFNNLNVSGSDTPDIPGNDTYIVNGFVVHNK